jgi:hypothetical protein
MNVMNYFLRKFKSLKNILLTISLLATSNLTYANRYIEYEESGGNMGFGGFVIFVVVPAILAFIFGTNEIRKVILKIILVIVCVCGYMLALLEFAKYVQYHLYPVKHGIGLISILVFVLGWFVPIWIWSKAEK